MSVTRLWWLSLALGTVVVAVVAWLLQRIYMAAKSVDQHAADIWVTGKQIAGNTVSIWMLDKTNEHLAGLTSSARTIERTAASMDEKLRAIGGSAAEER